MDKLGIIGCGTLEQWFLNRFLTSKVISANKVIISSFNCSRQQVTKLKKKFAGIQIYRQYRELAEKCSKIFICARSHDFKSLLEEIIKQIHHDAHLISMAASVSIGHMERLFPGKISRIAPLMISEADKGFTFVCHNNYVGPSDSEYILKLLKVLGSVEIINESQLESLECLILAARDFISALFREFTTVGARYGKLSHKKAQEMVIETFYGTSQLFYEGIMKFPDTVSHVATEGGITEVGNALLRKRLPLVFEQLFDRIINNRTTPHNTAPLPGYE